MNRSIRQFLLIAVAAASALGVVVLLSAYRIVTHVPDAVEELSRLQISELAAGRLETGLGELEEVLLVRAGYRTMPPPATADSAAAALHLQLNDLRASSEGLPIHGQVQAFGELARAVATAPGGRRLFEMDARESLAALERLAAARAGLRQLRIALADATGARRDVYRRAQVQVKWLTAGVIVSGLALAAFVFTTARQHIVVLRAVTSVARAVAGGDFSRRVPGDGPEELHDLAAALNSAAEGVAERDRWVTNTLREAERRRHLLSATIEATSDGIVMYDDRGEILLHNGRCAELLALTEDALRQSSVVELQEIVRGRCERPDQYEERLRAHFEAAGTHQDLLVLKTPARRVLRRTSLPLRSSAFAGGRVFTYTDVTTEANLDRMKSEFVSMASHELRTPLTSVHGALQLAIAGSGGTMLAEDRELLDISLRSTERLVRLVDDLLDLSKIEAGRMPMRQTRLDPREVVACAVEAMRTMARTHGIALEVRGDALAGDIRADADLLARVLTNLISNAVKYSPRESTVIAGVQALDGAVAIFVDDQGPGIEPEDADRLFKPFSRVGEQEYDRSTGTGLGLAISRAIVEQHDGRVWAERRHGGGTRFAVRLPALLPEGAVVA